MTEEKGSMEEIESKVECPQCKETMAQLHLNMFGSYILIDYCDACQGYWYDKGELDKVLDGDKLESVLNRKKPNKEGSRFPCPRCGADLSAKVLNGVIIDQCKECQGIWLDKNELYLIQHNKTDDESEKKLVDLMKEI